MIHRLEQVLVMDTDDMPGRGGYGVVGISPGVSQTERLFVAENFGISDYLHDPQNDRQLFSVFRIPGGRRVLVRRFGNGTRRNGTQNRLFVHTLFLEDAVEDAVHGLPWLLADAHFHLPGDKTLHPLTLERGPLLSHPDFPALEWTEEAELTNPPVQRFNARMKRVDAWLAQAGYAGVNATNAVAAVIAALRSTARVVLPQGPLFEQLTLLAWSMLPIGDREALAWTQHDSQNTVIPFAVANATQGPNVDIASGATNEARWVVEMNTESVDTWREFHDKTARCNLTARGDQVGDWRRWRNALHGVVEKVNAVDVEIEPKLAELAKAASPKVAQPWVDGVEVLQILWGNVDRAIAASEPANKVIERWASRLVRTELHQVIFRVPPPAEWLDARAAQPKIGPDLLVDFVLRCTMDEAQALTTRMAVARWALERRRSRRLTLRSDTIARLAGAVMADDSSVIEPLLDWLLEDPNGLEALDHVRQVTGYDNLVLLATLIALRRQHPQTAAYMRKVLLPRLEKSKEMRARINDVAADAVAILLREDPDAFIRFAATLGEQHTSRLTELVGRWLAQERTRTLPLAREIVLRTAANRYPAVPPAATLAINLALLGEPAEVWFRVVLRAAKKLDDGPDPALIQKAVTAIGTLDVSGAPGPAVIEPLIDHLNSAADAQARVGRAVRALILMARPVWTPRLAGAVAGVLAYTGRTAEWDSVVAALAEQFGSGASPLIRRFWERIDPIEVPNVSEATVEATSVIDGADRDQLLATWVTRLRRIPAGERCERFIDVLMALWRGAAGSHPRIGRIHIPLAWRELELRSATEETLNGLDEDLWNQDGQRYENEMLEALTLWSRREGEGALARTRGLLELLASPRVQPSVKFVCEGMIGDVLAALNPAEWMAVVKLPPDTLFARGTTSLLLARQLGASGAEEAALLFESACRMRRRSDASDCMALGRRERKPWRRLQRAIGLGSGERASSKRGDR